MDPVVRNKLQKISQYMKTHQMTVKQMHELLDDDKNGFVDNMEFVTGLDQLRIPGLSKKDCSTLFDCIDID